jgi:hypothetical protein
MAARKFAELQLACLLRRIKRSLNYAVGRRILAGPHELCQKYLVFAFNIETILL